ncbi:MAG: putative DNA binding domain-containing protein [Anaerolineales bacterium]|nr:putative DNA binding domain-containing protein [Anaerolineales bacterium]
MTKESVFHLNRLLAEGESETIEFKESFDEEAVETISAFANANGGVLLVGVADDGTVKGLPLGKETLRDWTNRIAQATHVHPHQIEHFSREGKTVVAIQVAESAIKPVPCRGRYFKRVGKSNRQMSDDDLTRAVLEKVGMTWDQVVEPRAKLTDLDPKQLRRFRKLCNLKGRRLIAEIFFNIGWIERWGSGIQKILDECAAAKLPEPMFEEKQGALWVAFRHDILVEGQLRSLRLSERQVRAVMLIEEKGSITNSEYQELGQVSTRTASRELADLVQKGILEQVGLTGKGTFYRLKASETRQTRH